ncbi:MAG: rhamnogalacturonan lyase [Paludibacteraceae bacterium]|nr:rhamnogalacturonan lyase [Paludibacteraceae bacterium]
MKHLFTNLLLLGLLLTGQTEAWSATKQMEYLDRGVVAVKVNNGVFISWRFLGTDDKSAGFNIYRDGTKVNETPITSKTNYVDTKGGANSKYVIKTVVGGKEIDASSAVSPWGAQYKTLNLKRPGNNYAANDMSVGDVDGDGQYELFVKWYPNNAKDNSQSGKTDNTLIDCYKLDGTFLWRIDLGINIRSGAHYTQFQVYDYDGDGKCEMVCKTAPGTKDGKGKNVIMGNDNPKADYRNGNGYVLDGPEYLTVFDGATGAEINTVAYTPGRGNVSAWGDSYGNRVDRFNACTAYLDGVHPSVVMCRGYYTRTTLAAYDFKDKKLVLRWYHNSDKKGQGAYGEGNHNVSVADVDGDGKDEIILGSAIIDDDGKTYSRTGFGHGDAMHVSDMDPDRPGLEGWFVHEDKGSAYGYEFRDLKGNKVIFGKKTNTDNGRGLAADIDAKHKGFEMWSSYNSDVFDCKGKVISNKKPSVNFRIYWDGDLQDELLDGTKCDKWNGNGTDRLITFKGNACNGTKNTPCLSADILGDWREEVIFHDGDKIYIYTTTIESKHRLFTLMHDPVYRCGIAWQNSSYNQPPHLGFYIGDGVDKISQPDIYTPGHEVTPPNPEVATLSYEGSLNQELLPNESVDLSFTFGGTATGVDVIGLPEGLSIKTDGNKVVILGTTAENGTFTVKTKGGDNEVAYKVNIKQVDGSLKRIAYITDTTNAEFKNDKIYQMLSKTDDLYVRIIDANNAQADLNAFDMVLISEVSASTAPIMANIEGIAKPVLNMKVHAYKSAEGAWSWAEDGYGDNTTATDLVVELAAQSHPMFKDIDFSNSNEIQMVSEVETKALTYMNPESFTNATGDIKSIASVKDENQVCILEIPVGASIAGTKISDKFIQIGLNSSSYANLTNDALSIVRNACYYLMGLNSATNTSDFTSTSNDMDANIFVSSDILRITFEADDYDEVSISMIGISGQVVDQDVIEIYSGHNYYERALSSIVPGVYIIKIQGAHIHHISKFIVEN